MTSTSAEHKADPDAIQAKIDLSVSKAHSLVQSWLPTSSTTDSPPDEHSDTDDEAPAPPRLGLGAAIPKEYQHKPRREISTNDALRRTMMGPKLTKPSPQQASKQTKKQDVQAEVSDEETGRSALGGSKRKRAETLLRKTKKTKTKPKERVD